MLYFPSDRGVLKFGPMVALALIFGFLALGLAVQAEEKTAEKDTPATQPSVGNPAPDFSLKTIDHQSVTLSELKKTGPVVVVELRGWVGYQCPVCTKQVADLRAHAKDFEKSGARIVLVYPGPASSLEQHASDFIGGKGLPKGFFFVLDPDLKFVNDWGLRWNASGETAYPATFVIDKKGVVKFKKVSKSHGDRAAVVDVIKALGDDESK